MKTILQLLLILLFSPFTTLHSQCGLSDWDPLISNDCGNLQASGGLAAGSPTIFCEGETVTIENNSSPSNVVANTYIDWGDGLCQSFSGFKASMTHAYDFPNDTCINNANGTIIFSCRLGVDQVCGNKKSFHYVLVKVVVRFKPVAKFTASPNPVCLDKTVNFNNASCPNSSSPDFLWSIAGQTFTTEDVSNFMFPSAGVFPASLTVTNICGSNTYTLPVTVLAPPVANGLLNITDFCAPAMLQLSSAGSLNALGYQWNIMTSNGGMYTWLDTVNNPQNLPNPKVLLKTAGTYTIKLTVHGAQGCDDATITFPPIIINDSPNINLAPPPPFCFENGPITYTPSATVISNGGYPNLSYAWFFENGSPATSNSLNPGPITWNQPGDWDIKLIVTGDPSPSNPCGRDTVIKTIHISPPSTVNVSHTSPPQGECGPYSISFSNTSTGTSAWEWFVQKNGIPALAGTDYLFENGSDQNSQNVTIRFLTSGNFSVQLHLGNVSCGPEQSQPFPFVVKTAPKIDATPVGLQCVPAQVNFPAAILSDGNDPGTTVSWSFSSGNPGQATGPGPHSIQFNQAGMPLVIVTATNACGIASDSFSFTLDAKTQVVLLPVPDSICKNSAPLQLQTNLPSACFPSEAPNGLLDPSLLPDGTNMIVVSNCATSPGCETKDTLSVFVMNVAVSIGTVPDFCDTLGTAAITGFFPANGQIFSGGPYITSDGTIDAGVAGFGTHTVVMTYQEPNLGCVFTLNDSFDVFEVPASGITGPIAGCTGVSQNFSFGGTPAGLNFIWSFQNGVPASSTLSNPSVQWPQSGDFEVRLIVVNSSGCSDTAYAQIHIEAPLTVAISAMPDPVEICPDDPVIVTVTVSGQNPQNWALYVGNYDTLPNFTSGQLMFASGKGDTTYTLTVSASNACPTESASLDVLVHPLPGPVLGVSSLSVCSGDTAFFYHTSTGGPFTSLQFDPGNGPVLPVLPVAGVRYFTQNDQITIYKAVLTLSNPCGTRSDTLEITVLPEDIIPAVQMNDTIFCVGDTLHLTSFASSVSHPNLSVSYHFSDGQTFVNPDVDVRLNQPGLFWLEQWITDGCSWDKVRRYFMVRPAPEADFNQIQDTICAGSTITHYKFPPDWEHQFRSFSWQFSDGTSGAGAEVEKIWPNPGWVNVTLTVTLDTSGCATATSKSFHIRQNPVPVAAALDSSACGRLTTSFFNANPQSGLGYEWAFSDGTTDVGSPVTHSFAGPPELFSATLKATDIWGCTAQATLDGLHVIPIPHPLFSVSEPFACGLGHTVYFNNLTTDAAGADWFLNNMYIGSHSDTLITFNQPGDFSIRLEVTNQWGCTNDTAYIFKVFPPLKAAAESPSDVCERDSFHFVNLSENADTYFWNFGDGASSNQAEPSYAYAQAGVYQVVLVAMQQQYCADTFSFPQPINVLESPYAGFYAVSSTMGMVQIVDTSKNAGAWLYEFPDLGITRTEQNPLVDYSANGLKLIIQTVTNALGCFDRDSLWFSPDFFGGLAVPNALIPDVGIGPHNCFTPTGEGLETFEMDIFSPWGTNVYHAEGVVNGKPTPDASWCGIDANGKSLPAGSYLWQINATYRRPDGSLQKWEGMTIGRGAKIRRTFGSVTLLK